MYEPAPNARPSAKGFALLALFSCSVEKAEDLATGVLAPGLLVVHDAERGRQHDVSKLRHNKQYQVGDKKKGENNDRGQVSCSNCAVSKSFIIGKRRGKEAKHQEEWVSSCAQAAPLETCSLETCSRGR